MQQTRIRQVCRPSFRLITSIRSSFWSADNPISDQFRTNLDFIFTIYVSLLVIRLGFVTVMAFKTLLWNVRFIELVTFWLFLLICQLYCPCYCPLLGRMAVEPQPFRFKPVWPRFCSQLWPAQRAVWLSVWGYGHTWPSQGTSTGNRQTIRFRS